MKSRLFRIAWAVRKQFSTFSEALKHAWQVIKLQFQLCTQAVVHFTYKKIDGSIRHAVGTVETVPPTKVKRPVNYSLLTYWDITAEGWRSCQIQNLIF